VVDNSFNFLVHLRHMVKTLLNFVSLPELILIPKPKTLIENRLIKLLKARLKELKIIWNPDTFRKGLSNPKMPSWLLEKLGNLIAVAEASGWRISNALALELDETVEDIESFNPAFRIALKRERKDALRDMRLGRAVSIEKIKEEVGVR